MRLKKIKLAGFKSFVDPTTIAFPSQLVGVVGPNGCGKSNVIDAVRWVMGESSAKNLRGESLADVIFNGSTARKPVGHATIELVFDNNDGSLGGQYAEYSEIGIKRQLSRDGQSSYFLNGARCRRRDITDIFLGTGLGPRSYSIIEQGTISRLIEAKPEELRIFLEEAAGISKYKERRKETESRIRSTKENINRIKDIIDELEKRLEKLQRQAKTAERYKELKQEERLLKAQLLALRWRSLDVEASERDKEIQSRETQLESKRAELRAVEADIEKQREAQVESNELFNQIQGRFYSVGAEIARIEQSIQHGNETCQQNQHDLTQVEEALAEAQSHLNQDQHQIESLSQSLQQSAPELTQAEQAEGISAAALGEAESAMHNWQGEWDIFNSQAAEQMQKVEVERTRIINLEDRLLRLQQRLQRLEDEQQQLTSQSLEAEAVAISGQVNESTATMEHLQQQMHALLAQISQQRELNNQLVQQLDQARRHQQEVQKQYASLEALQLVALGKQEENVSLWLEEHGLQDARRLAETLQVEKGWERAVETVLGLNLEAICVDNMELVAAELSHLQKGTLTVFDTTSPRDASDRQLATPLLSKVSAPWKLDSLFANVFAVENITEAFQLRDRLEAQDTVITRDGIWIGRDWMRVVRESGEKTGVLVREQELKQLTTQLAGITEQVESLDIEYQDGNSRIQSLSDEREALQTALNDTSRKHAELLAQMSSKDAHLEQIKARNITLTGEINEIRGHFSTDTDELSATRGRLEQALAETERHGQQRNALIQKRDELRAVLDNKRDQARRDRDAAREIDMRIKSMTTQLNSLRDTSERMKSQVMQLSNRRQELSTAIDAAVGPLEAMKVELEQQLAKRLEVEGELGKARLHVEECEHTLRELNERRGIIEQHLQDMRGDLETLRMGAQEIKVRRQTLNEQIDESGYQLETLFNEMPENANDEEWQRSVEQIDNKIQRLGAINLAAIDEYTEQSERKEYLDAQFTDLNDALNTLENAIRKIDHETRSRFQATFDHVNDRLQELFPRLFGGGVAQLEMTSDDLLDSGVTVMARPPGKRNSNIHLLSGGEKALTAVALVFAIFELNPAPFCMLDEVDAPLDDSNTARFCQMVKEMSDRVQFIFITHNKITMEMANQLLGVTMHEPGVSRLVAVDVDEAVEMVAAG